MAKFYLQDIPQTPAARGQPQAAEVPVGPYRASDTRARYEQLSPLGQRVASIDIAKNIPSLMQQGLPENLSNALVGGQLAVGKAWGKASDAFSNLAETGVAIAAHMQNANEIASKATARNLIDSNYAAYQEEVANNRLTKTEAYDLLVNKYQPQLDKDLGSLSLAPRVADEVIPYSNLQKARQRTDAREALNKEQYDNRTDQFNMDRKNGLQSGDLERADNAVHDRYAAGDITKEVRDRLLAENKEVYQESETSKDIQINPRPVVKELENLAEGGESKLYPNLKNRATILSLLGQARQALHNDEVDAHEEIRDKIKSGEIKTQADIENVNAGRLEQHVVDAYVKDIESPPIPLNYEAVSDIRAEIAGYNPKSDPTFQKHNEINQRILTEIPKPATGEKNALREQLFDELAQREKDVNANAIKPGKEYWDALKGEIHNETKDGLIFGDPRPGMIWGEWPPRPVEKLKTAEERSKVFEREQTAIRGVEEWMTAHPDATVDEIRDKAYKVIGPDAMKAATEKLKEKARGAAPSVAPPSQGGYYMGTPQAAAPKEPLYVVGPKPEGMVEQGNIDLNNRPIIHNRDGTISSERSFSFQENGKEVLIPLIVNGKVVTRQEAIDHYHQTGEHMGKFKDAASADAYAEKAHNRPMPTTSSLGGKLKGTEDLFAAAGARHGVDPNLMMAIANHETGRGQSDFLKSFNNPGGLMDPATNWQKPQRFASLGEGVDAMAKNLRENYLDKGLTTIAQIAPVYAPVRAANDPRGLNKDWQAGVTKFYNQGTGQSVEIDKRSAEQIASLKPEAQGKMASFISRARAWAHQNGLDVFIGEGYRSPERQAELYAQGRTKPGAIVTNARPGQSNHQSGRAVDLVLTRGGKQIDDKKIWRQLANIAKSMGLEWGGDFKSIYDPEHFQVPS